MDVLRWPVIGPLLRWRHARTSFQLVLLAAAVVVVVHGLIGPDLGSTNLATVLTWVHYRGLVVVGLLAAGNLFCAGCPFIRSRDWARKLHAPSRTWPSWLRGKWIAILLFAGVLFAYELFDLWSLPGATAYLVIAYFAGAIAIDTVFKGATFCKHLCPVGQFNFVASTMSPLELRAKDLGVCGTCRTEDCIAGRRSPHDSTVVVQRGCELGLFMPAKIGNVDCTFCLDCVQACPHDNIGLSPRTPGAELADARRRSGIGRFTERWDLALLVVVFVFAALTNALAMVAPIHRLEVWLAGVLGTSSETLVLGVIFVCGVAIVPVMVLGVAAGLTRVLAGDRVTTIAQVSVRYAYGLVPFGLGVWVAHYGFHFLTGALVVVPVVQNAAIDLAGQALLGEPLWRWAGMRPGAVFPIQLGVIVLGTIGSIGVLQLISERDYPGRALRAMAPWLVAVVALAALAIWVMFQPMEMRGTGMLG